MANMSQLSKLLAHPPPPTSRRRPEPTSWRPELKADEVRVRLKNHGLDAPEEIVEWFGWHNGDRM